MTEATRFLTGVAQALSTMTLYKEGHPARERAIDTVYRRSQDLLDVVVKPEFTFLGGEIVYDRRPLPGLKHWEWGSRLAEVGIQRLELVSPLSRDELEVFLEDALSRISGEGIPTAEIRQTVETNIRYGTVGLKSQKEGGEQREIHTATIGYSLRDEVDALGWLHDELKDRERLHMLEAEAIVRSLSVAMYGDQQFMIPLLRLKRFDQYTTSHALNVAVLAMSLSEFIGLTPREVKTFGISGLLHDLGKVRIPDEILNKKGKLTDQEREVMNGHTVEGARIILETEDDLDMAAVVAYEHHVRLDGAGYPSFSYSRACHQASNMVHVCDVFDALRTERPYRDAWNQETVLGYITERAGTEFEPELAHAFVQMMRAWSDRIAVVRGADEELPIAGSPGLRAGTGPSEPGKSPEPREPTEQGESIEPAQPRESTDPEAGRESKGKVVWNIADAASEPPDDPADGEEGPGD